MSNSAPRNGNGNEKRAVLPKQLDKLDLVLEREKSARGKQNGSKIMDAKKPKAKYDAIGDSNQSSNAPSGTSSGAQAREKSPTKQQQQNSIKVAVAASSSRASSNTPSKRPESAPVKPTAKTAADVTPGRASVVGKSVSPSKNDVKKSLVAGQDSTSAKLRKSTMDSSSMAQQSDDEADDVDGGKGGALSDALADEEPPARGHYDIFIQTRQCESLCLSLGLTLQHIRKMKKKYDVNGMYCTGEITQAEFFFMINEEERPISKGIFKFGGIAKDQKYISFDQYLLCVVQFASLTKPELFQFVFDLYDDDQSNSLDEREFTKMSKELQSKQFCFPKNVEMAIKMLGGGTNGGRGVGIEDGLVGIAQFMKFARKFPVAFYPIANMQKNIRAATLGEAFWSRIVARQLKIQDLLSYMCRNYGAIPEMTTRERLWSFFSDDIFYVRKRATELYASEVAHRR